MKSLMNGSVITFWAQLMSVAARAKLFFFSEKVSWPQSLQNVSIRSAENDPPAR
jgi:hypothetical protein